MSKVLPFLRQPSNGLSPEHRRILQGVSRSFDLSIRLLPQAVQAPVAIGYLLARATDTVADTTALPRNARHHLLGMLTQFIESKDANPTAEAQLGRQTRAFAAQQSNPHEKALMQALPQCLPLLRALSEADQASVRQVLRLITQGQDLDMARFGTSLQALQTEDELDQYTYLVAGCVGEFWTELCERHLPGYAHLPQAEMLRIGREYGMGLQRLNIVRDAGDDLAAGRCYWPEQTLAQAGLTPAMLAQAAQAARSAHNVDGSGGAHALLALTPLYEQWLNHTQTQLACGLRYAMAVKPLRLRLASALPALLGARTIALLRRAGPAGLTQHIKMPRREVRLLIWRIALGWGSPAVLERQFQQLSGPCSPCADR
jgi:farnesyl-diphosphate farnesyltransferase